MTVSIPSYVQVVDWQIITSGIRPYTVYCIVSKLEEGGKQIGYCTYRIGGNFCGKKFCERDILFQSRSTFSSSYIVQYGNY